MLLHLVKKGMINSSSRECDRIRQGGWCHWTIAKKPSQASVSPQENLGDRGRNKRGGDGGIGGGFLWECRKPFPWASFLSVPLYWASFGEARPVTQAFIGGWKPLECSQLEPIHSSRKGHGSAACKIDRALFAFPVNAVGTWKVERS